LPYLVRFQLLSSAADALALDILHALGPLVSSQHCHAKVRSWAKGWRQVRFEGESLGALIEILSGQTANEIEIDFGITAPYAIGASGLTLHSLKCSLKLSPTNSLWMPASGYILSGMDEASRATHESRELALKWNDVVSAPTLLDTLLELSEEARPRRVLRAFWEALPRVLPKSPVWRTVSGCADPWSLGVFSQDVLEVLAPWPRSYSLLGERFDDLHPILIGPVPICEGLARTLGEEAELSRAHDADGTAAFGLLHIADTAFVNPAHRDAVQEWLVPRDAGTAPRALREDVGEFRMGAHVLYSLKRQKELEAQGRLPTMPEGLRYFPLVGPKYCAQLGIDPNEMPVDLWQEGLIEKARAEIDRNFDSLAVNLPLIERVWRAHEATYSRWLYGADARLAFLRARLFAAHSHRSESR